ncbi:MAG TPA: hypothetical protein VGD64_04095 [Acidisarcina sp.]
MNRSVPILCAVSLALAAASVTPSTTAAQDAPTMPKVLQITREFVKPYKGGAAHNKTESAFIQAATKAKFPAHYVALNSMSGKARALFITSYSSFAEWGKDNDLVTNNKTLAADFERASVADGALLDSVDSGVFTYDEDLSYKPHADLSHARYMEISVFHVRPGHAKEWYDLAKMVKEGHDKAGDSAHWGMFEIAYGADDGTYLAFSADASLADIDTGYSENKKWRDAMGDEGMKKLSEVSAKILDRSESELFSINPAQSYVSDDWVKSDPKFWKPKPMAASAPKPAMKDKKATP